MTAYRKKPVNVDAYRFKGDPDPEQPQWLIDAAVHGRIVLDKVSASIYTDSGPQRVNVGDWIIQGADGRMWATDDHYFNLNYGAAPTSSPVQGLPVDESTADAQAGVLQ